MSNKSIGSSNLTSESVVSGSLVIVNTVQGYAVTGASLSNNVPIYSLITTPGTTGDVVQIGTAGVVAAEGGTGPTITSLTVTDESWTPVVSQFIDSVSGGYVEIIGTQFDEGAIAYLNAETLTTTRVDATKLRIVIPPTPAGAYSIMVFNSDSAGTIFSNINLSVAPSFITAAGSLGSFFEVSNVNIFVQANADSTLTYSVASGALPSGVNLNSDGTITGTTPGLSSNTNYSFAITATDVELQAASRSFSLTVNPDIVTWLTPSNNLSIATLVNKQSDNVLLTVSTLVSSGVTYTGTGFPTGISIVSGNITGTPSVVGTSNVVLAATSDTTSKFANINIQYKVLEPYILQNYDGSVKGIKSLSNATFVANILGAFTFDPSGGNLYVVNTSTGTATVLQYTMSTNWDITTATLSNLYDQTDETTPRGIYFKDDGSKFYLVGPTSDAVQEYSVSSNWNVSTASKIGSFSVSAQETNPDDVYFKSDGTIMYVSGTTGDDINVYALSTPWQANTASYTGLFKPSPTVADPRGIAFNSSGTKLYVFTSATGSNDSIFQFDISPPWDILASSNVSTGSYSFGNTASVGAIFSEDYNGMYLGPDDKKLFMMETTEDAIVEYQLQTASDITTTKPGDWNLLSGLKPTGFNTGAPDDLFIKPDGTKIYIAGGSDKIAEYNLTTPYDVASAIFAGNSFITTALETTLTSLFFKSDGTKMYFGGSSSDRIWECNLSTAWQANTATVVGNILVSGQEGTIRSMFIKPDGDKMYIVGSVSDRVHEYILSTPWQVNSAAVVGNVLIAEDGTSNGLTFSEDGNIMFIVGETNDKIYRYNLSTPWQANTAVANSNIALAIHQLNPSGIQFARDGFYMYVSAADDPAIVGGINLFTGITRYRLI